MWKYRGLPGSCLYEFIIIIFFFWQGWGENFLNNSLIRNNNFGIQYNVFFSFEIRSPRNKYVPNRRIYLYGGKGEMEILQISSNNIVIESLLFFFSVFVLDYRLLLLFIFFFHDFSDRVTSLLSINPKKIHVQYSCNTLSRSHYFHQIRV